MKITIITVVYNGEEFLENCILSVIGQTYGDIEYIIIDGGSGDSSLSIIDRYRDKISIVVSEKDRGIYDAMNKGIVLAGGEVIGFLNADDFFADDAVIARVAAAFARPEVGVVYGDLWYVSRTDPERVIRRWESSPYSRNSMAWGWMPAHPTFYARSDVYRKYGGYDLKFKSAADYELMLRFLYLKESNSLYLPRVFVKMRMGGVSNRSFYNRLLAANSDRKAMGKNGIRWPWIKMWFKPLRKICQYF
ncbi:glycosyltransferase [Flavihumibacter sp. R14]|nr:glycosyltransferase [Flavihumibacter soli]